LRFGAPANEFIFDAIVDRMWEVAQGRFGARSMRACLESPHISINQQRRTATAIILNSIPLATNPNGALLLTWLLDTSGFPSRYNLLAPRFTPHLSHLCTHKLASLTVLRIVNQKIEPDASSQIVEALFSSPGDHVLTDVLGDQVNGVAVVHKILTSPFIDPNVKHSYVEATKRVLIELKVIATQAYRRLIEEVGLPVPNFQPTYNNTLPPTGKVTKNSAQNFGVPGLPSGYPSNDQGFASMMAALQMGGQNPQAGPPNPPQLHVDAPYNPTAQRRTAPNAPPTFSPATDPFNPFNMRSPETGSPRQVNNVRRMPGGPSNAPMVSSHSPYGNQSPILPHGGPLPGMNQLQAPYGGMPPQSVPPHVYQPYMYQPYQQNPPSNMGSFHA
jgi:protein JSN1